MASCISGLIHSHDLDLVCLQETMKRKYSPAFFRKLDPGDLFQWDWIPSVGKSGGILCGTRCSTFDISRVKCGKNFLMTCYPISYF